MLPKRELDFLYTKCKEFIKERIDAITNWEGDHYGDLELYRFEVDHLRNASGGVPLETSVFRCFLKLLHRRFNCYYTKAEIDKCCKEMQAKIEELQSLIENQTSTSASTLQYSDATTSATITSDGESSATLNNENITIA